MANCHRHLRILFVVHRYWPSIGGVEKYVQELGRAVRELGHHVEVIAGVHTTDLPPEETHEGIPIHRFPARRSPLRCRGWLWRRRKLVAAADVVSVSNTHMLEYFWRMFGPLAEPRKVFLIRHGMACNHPVPDAQKRRARRSADLAAGVVHDGRFIETWLGVKPDLCPDQGLNPTADELPFVPEPAPNSAVFVGRLEPDSGIRMYIDAVRILNDRARSGAPGVAWAGAACPCDSDPQARADPREADQSRVASGNALAHGHTWSSPETGVARASRPLKHRQDVDATYFRNGHLARARHRGFSFDVYGDGTLGDELRALVDRESLPVVFHGKTPNAQDHLTDGCFAFVDGRMTIQEAMARRRLVLAAYVDPLKRDYVMGESFSPHLIAGGSAHALAERVSYYIDHPAERAAIVQGAFEYTRSLTWARTAKAYVDFWQERLANPRITLSHFKRTRLALGLELEAAGAFSRLTSPKGMPADGAGNGKFGIVNAGERREQAPAPS